MFLCEIDGINLTFLENQEIVVFWQHQGVQPQQGR